MKDRIAIVVNTLSGGGAEKTAANLSRLLSDRYLVDIIVNDVDHMQYSHHGRVFSLCMPEDKNRMSFDYQIRALFRRTRMLKRLKKKRHYKVVISFSEMTNLANVLSGGNTVISVHNSVSKSKINGWKHRIVAEHVLPFCFKRANRTISCSKELADELIRDYGLPAEKSSVIYNGVDLKKIREESAMHLSESLTAQDEKLIVTVGRLTWEKDHRHLIRVIGKLQEEGLNVKLIILGEGSLRTPLEELVAEMGLEGKVLLPGFVQNPFQYMAKADAVVFSSLTEGFSNAIVEALACGAPVISTDHETGAREILAPDTDYTKKVRDRIEECAYGILVPVCEGGMSGNRGMISREELLMTEAIRRILTDNTLEERYRQVSIVRAEQLSIVSICRQWIDVIEAVGSPHLKEMQ